MAEPIGEAYLMPMTDAAVLFQSIVDAVNIEAFAMTGTRSTCILATYALAHVLGRLGYRAYPLRVEAAVHHRTDRTFCGTLLGRDPWDRQAAERGAWHGHLVAAVETEWLLDPTLDQANKPEWGAHHVRPLAVLLPESFWTDPCGHVVEVGELDVRYCPYRRPQAGFAHAGDARPSHWRPVANVVLARFTAHGGIMAEPIGEAM